MRLITWNLQNFWSIAEEPLLIRPNGEPSRVRPQRLLDRTAAAVQALDADILCLQEIGGEADVAFLAPGCEIHCEHRLKPAASPRERKHGTGLAIRQGMFEIERLPDIPLSQAADADAYARDGMAIRLTAWGQSFILVNLHLKAGCRDKLRLDKRKPCRILGAQIDILCAWIADQSDPLILGGDFNRVLAQPRDTVWKKLQAARKGELRLLNTRYGQIDHFVLSPEFKIAQGESLRGTYGNFTDHQPRILDLKMPLF